MVYEVKKFSLEERKSMKEAFRAGQAVKMMPKIARVLSKRIKKEIVVAPTYTEYSNANGKFVGYYAGIANGRLLRFNFKLTQSDTIVSVDYWLKPAKKPTYTIDLKGFNIVQVIDMLADIITGKYFGYADDAKNESTKRMSEARGGHKAQIIQWLGQNSDIIRSLSRRGATDFDDLMFKYNNYSQSNNNGVITSVASFRVYVSQALKELRNPASENVPVVAVERGVPERVINTTLTDEEVVFENEVLNNAHIHKFALMKLYMEQVKMGNPAYRGVYVYGQGGIGKAQPLYSNILTPVGWRTMGEIEKGDEVLTPSGEIASVVGVFPQGKKDIYELTFADGSKARSCNEHLWAVYKDGLLNNKMVVDLDYIMEKGILDTQGRRRWAVPLVEKPIDYKAFTSTKEDLPVDPYILGFLLGDGCFTQDVVTFSSSEDFIVEKLNSYFEAKEENLIVTKIETSKWDYRIALKEGRNNHNNQKPNSLKLNLRKLGLMGKNSKNKFIPDVYLYASIEDRIKLVQGLMDSDGFIAKNGVAQISLVNEIMIDQFRTIVKSLGGWASKTEKSLKDYDHSAYTITFDIPDEIIPVTLPRKVERWQNKKLKKNGNYITDISYIGKEEAQCIMIDNEEHLYITDDFTVTHNTYFAEKILKPLPNCTYYSGNIAGYTGLLEILFNNRRDKIIVLDDILSATHMKNNAIENILKTVLDPKENRHVYIARKSTVGESTSNTKPKLTELDDEELFDFASGGGVEGDTGETMYDFDFNSTVVFITNYGYIPQALDDRCWKLEMIFSNAQIIDLINTALIQAEPEASLDDMNSVFNFLTDTKPSTDDKTKVLQFMNLRNSKTNRTFSFRLFHRCLALYMACKHIPNWKLYLAIEIGT